MAERPGARIRAPHLAVVLSVVVGLVAAGCGGGSAAAASAAATAAPSSEPVTATAVATPAPTEVPTEAPTPTPEPTVAAVDPCSLLTMDEARAAVDGIKVGDPQPAGQPPVRCVWPTPTSGAVGQVEIDVGDGAKKTFDIDHQLGHDFKAQSGLGDEAWLEPDTIFFRKGDTWVAIHVVMLNDPAQNDKRLLAAAALVASRL